MATAVSYQIASGSVPRYFGQSTDTKPSAADNLPRGATFYELDTKVEKIWDGSEWVAKADDSVTSALMVDLLRDLVVTQRMQLERLDQLLLKLS